MPKKPPAVPAHANPLYNEEKPLPFDTLTEEELLSLTPAQQADRFMSEWMMLMKPFTNYQKTLTTDPASQGKILRNVKVFYKKCVVENGWSEKKYALALDHLFTNGFVLSHETMTLAEKLYDNNALLGQLRTKQARKKRI